MILLLLKGRYVSTLDFEVSLKMQKKEMQCAFVIENKNSKKYFLTM